MFIEDHRDRDKGERKISVKGKRDSVVKGERDSSAEHKKEIIYVSIIYRVRHH